MPMCGCLGRFVGFERRRSSAMPMLSMKTKNPMKPTLETAEITDDAGLSSPNHPASAPTSKLA